MFTLIVFDKLFSILSTDFLTNELMATMNVNGKRREMGVWGYYIA